MSENRHSNVACYACRHRKVKCSKELPHCFNCFNCGQRCSYPSGMQKPGPKLGSVHKRRKVEGSAHTTTTQKRHWEAASSNNSSPRKQEQHCNVSTVREMSGLDKDVLLCSKHIESVSHLILQSHESSSPESVRGVTPSPDIAVRKTHLASSCKALGVTLNVMEQIVQTFFRTFTSFRLFKEPDFFSKLLQIYSDLQLKALLAIMFSFAWKCTDGKLPTRGEQFSANNFAELAIGYAEKAILECGDNQPPLCLLQALILVTHWLVIKGVRGRAWRYLGLCIRIVFEIGLHSVDAGKESEAVTSDTQQWCEDEERRRAYWAVWEMDQFANILKQAPMMMDWTRNQVFLPVEDDQWFQGQPQHSSILESDLLSRSNTLQATGNKSAKAWFIVLNSLVGEAYTLACTSRRINRSTNKGEITSILETEYIRDCPNTTLLKSIRVCLAALPSYLKFHGQHLDFGTRTFDQSLMPSVLHLQSSIYQVTMMPEVARIIALRPYVFDEYVRRFGNRTGNDPRRDTQQEKHPTGAGPSIELEDCYNAADAILNLVINCNGSHYQYVNPYVSHAPWMAATVQLLRQELTDDEFEKKLIYSKFEILKYIHERCVQHWEMSSVPKQNLSDLATRLKQFTAVSMSFTEGRKTTAAFWISDPTTHPSRGIDDCRMHSGKYEQFANLNKKDSIDGNPNDVSNLEYSSATPCSTRNNISQSMDQSLRNSQNLCPSPSVTASIHSKNIAQRQDPSQIIQSELGDPEMPLFCHSPKLQGTILDPIRELAETSHIWNQVDSVHEQESGVTPDLDWLNFYAEVSGELSDYLDEVYSGPFIG